MDSEVDLHWMKKVISGGLSGCTAFSCFSQKNKILKLLASDYKRDEIGCTCDECVCSRRVI